MTVGESLTRWTIRLALACYVLALAYRLTGKPRQARLAWTVGCVIYLAHVACAFQFFHGWRHTAAYQETARRTAALFGWDWGGGLYLNYAFTIAWVVDVGWWWRGLERYQARPRGVDAAVQGFMAFMAFNATVVFETGPVRWLGLVACLVLAIVAIWARCMSK